MTKALKPARASATVAATALLAALVTPGAAATSAGSTADTVADTTPPTGDYALLSATSTDDPGPMVVEIVQQSVDDDVTADADIARAVNWGTGQGFVRWDRGRRIDHTYRKVGRFQLRVRLTDEAGNRNVVDLGTVVVTDDFAPRLRVDRPGTSRRYAWRWLDGRAHDVGLAGLAWVRVVAVQHRGRGWFSYLGPGHGWRYAGHRQAAARSDARVLRLGTNRKGHWAVKLGGLHRGRVVVRLTARDQEGNRSATTVLHRRLR